MYRNLTTIKEKKELKASSNKLLVIKYHDLDIATSTQNWLSRKWTHQTECNVVIKRKRAHRESTIDLFVTIFLKVHWRCTRKIESTQMIHVYNRCHVIDLLKIIFNFRGWMVGFFSVFSHLFIAISYRWFCANVKWQQRINGNRGKKMEATKKKFPSYCTAPVRW